MSTLQNTRLRVVFDDLQSTVVDLMVKHGVTREEFGQAIAFVKDLVEADEFDLMLLPYFGYGVAAANEGREYANPERDGASTFLPTGPAYVPGAPVLERPYVLPMRPDEPGETLFVSGQIRSTSGEPLAGAELDIWMANNVGDYSNMTPEMLAPLVLELDESLPPFNLRGRMLTDEDGRFEYRTVMPRIEDLGIPDGGPLDRFFRNLGHVEVRPLHIHAVVSATGFHTLITQAHFSGDPNVGNTTEPRSTPESSVFETQLHDDPNDYKNRGLDAPYYTMTIDYVLRPVAPAA
ncbi:dioxygenase family protein [Streptomyces caniscabiei]|uniref:dioxygenase family protein n=1 Tax=Streptomyces caniscabiei TaxID=2746961 RepID=UPI0029B69F80|nr:catechol 1,2-dioxygenase [Streptomyces caniscabiei]MDX2735602.1 catechol 1,2-dioxygenase [Streptomyces caniscabiei]